jgi:U3 small nucleolar RNA-associated protein 18
MGKHSKKRQRTTRDGDTSNLKPLGSIIAIGDEDDKDEEEKRLETLLFGTTFPVSNTAQSGSLLHEKETNEVTIDADGGLANLLDSDVSCNHCLANFTLTHK